MRTIGFIFFFLGATLAPALAQGPLIIERELCSTLDDIAAGQDVERAATAARVRAMACRLPVDDIDAAAAEAALGDAPIRFERRGDTVTIIARSAQQEAQLCCSLHAPMTRIVGGPYWAARFRLAELDRAMLSFRPPERVAGAVQNNDWIYYRGPDAPPAPPIQSQIEGQEIDTTLWSPELRETRRIKIYLPPGHEAGGDYATLIVADGNSVGYYARMIEPMISRREIEPLVLVGILSGQAGIVEDRSQLNIDLRAADYLPNWEGAGDRFEQHLRFVTETVTPFAEQELHTTRDRTRRGVAGFSNGAVFAYWAAVHRPDLFGVSIVRSSGYLPSGATEVQLNNTLRSRFFMSAGLYETRFWLTTHARAEDLRAHGYDVTFLSMAAGHAPDQGNVTLTHFVRAAFPARRPLD